MSMLWWFNRAPAVDADMAQSVASPVPVALPNALTEFRHLSAKGDPASPALAVPEASSNLERPKTVASCTWNAQEAGATITPQWPTKKGDMVFLQVQSEAHLCVIDGAGQSWQAVLKADQGMNFYGAAPWRVFSPNLTNTLVYFQGQRIRFDTQSLVLNEAPGPF